MAGSKIGVCGFQECFQRRAPDRICKSRPKRNPPFPAGSQVERTGIEPVTSGLQSHLRPDDAR